MMGEVRDEGNVELDSEEDEDDREEETVTVGGVQYHVGKKRKKKQSAKGAAITMGETVKAGEYSWTRIEGMLEDSRKEPHFDTTFKSNLFNENATEVDIFKAFMPLSKTTLLNIVRANADEDGDKRLWLPWHIDATLAIILGERRLVEHKAGWDVTST